MRKDKKVKKIQNSFVVPLTHNCFARVFSKDHKLKNKCSEKIQKNYVMSPTEQLHNSYFLKLNTNYSTVET